MSKSGKAKFYNHITTVNWVAFLQSASDLDSCASLFFESLKYVLDICFPIKSVRLRPSDPPWLKPGLKILINERDKAWSNGQRAKYLRLREKAASLKTSQGSVSESCLYFGRCKEAMEVTSCDWKI